MRYDRNKPIISEDIQEKIGNTNICIIGLGGLGGQLVELIARLGFKKLILIDGDIFNETNLNRQILSTEDNIGKFKADIAKERVNMINSKIDVSTHKVYINSLEDIHLFEDSHLIMDGLDNVKSRLLIQEIAFALDIPLIHGAIGGWEGQYGFFSPDKNRMSMIYSEDAKIQKVANLTHMPNLIACMQVSLLIQYMINPNFSNMNKLFRINVLDNSIIEIDLS